MSDESAILAQFSDWRTVKGRKVLQLIFEVPLEDQAKVLTHLGAPMPMADLWCGIARVARKGKAGDAHDGALPSGIAGAVKSAVEPGASPPPATDSVTLVEGETGGAPRALTAAPPVSKSKRRWSEMPPPQRAALMGDDPLFEPYVRQEFPKMTFEDAPSFIRTYCEVRSRSEITNENRWFGILENGFLAFRQAKQHGVI